jgi:hypothetical protein
MEVYAFLGKWFWLFGIVVTFINAALAWIRVRSNIQEHPELRKGYLSLIWGQLILGIIYCVILGIGTLTGQVHTFYEVFRPRDGNPFVLAFLGSTVLTWLLGTYWIFLRGGAEMLNKHPGVIITYRSHMKRPWIVKLLWLVSVACGVLGLILMWTIDIPLPPELM